MKPYQVVATGDQSGIIEVVVNSETTADIQQKYGGTFGAIKKETLKDFLSEHNPEDQFEKALDNFTRSRLLCGNLYSWNRRPAQRKHYDDKNRAFVPHRLRPLFRQF